jgi:hypothetical protein
VIDSPTEEEKRSAARTEESTQRARRGRIALVISVALNLFGAAYFWRLFELPRERLERDSRTEVVTIEKRPPSAPRPIPTPHIAKVPPVPHVRVRPQPVVAAAAAPAPLSRAPKPTPDRVPPRAAPRPAELAKNGGGAHARPVPVPAAPTTTVSKRERFSAQKIAKITQDLQGEIDADRGAHGALAVAPEPAPTMKKFAMDIGDLTAGSLSHHGLCDPIRDWKADGFDYYYVACNVRFSDGTFQRQDVPWPVRFPPEDDPFAGTARKDKPLAMPLPGWHLGPGESVTVELREYAHDHGVDI